MDCGADVVTTKQLPAIIEEEEEEEEDHDSHDRRLDLPTWTRPLISFDVISLRG